MNDIQAKRTELQVDLTKEKLAELEAALNSIQTRLAEPSPDHGAIQGALVSLKNVLEGATGSVVASGWLTILEGLPF